MMQSETIGKLADALAKAQGEMRAVTKTRTAWITGQKSNYSYNYADLADVIEASRGVLAKNGLSIIQTYEPSGDALTLVTTLAHSSGEWVRSILPVIAASGARPQELGSAMTYMRRYAYTAIIGMAAEEDDDGAAAQDAPKAQARLNGNGAQGKTAAPQSNGELTEDKAIAFVGAYKTKLMACQTAHDVAALGEKNGANLERLRRAFPEYHQGLVDLIDAKLADLRAAEEPGIAA